MHCSWGYLKLIEREVGQETAPEVVILKDGKGKPWQGSYYGCMKDKRSFRVNALDFSCTRAAPALRSIAPRDGQ